MVKKLTIGMAVVLGISILIYVFMPILSRSSDFGTISMLVLTYVGVILGYCIISYLVALISKNLKYGLIGGLAGLALFQLLLGIGIAVDLMSSDAWRGLVTVLIAVYFEPPMVILAIISIVFLIRIKKGKTPEKLQ